MEDVSEDELVIMRIETDTDGNDYYVSIDDENELNAVYEEYLAIVEADEDEDAPEEEWRPFIRNRGGFGRLFLFFRPSIDWFSRAYGIVKP